LETDRIKTAAADGSFYYTHSWEEKAIPARYRVHAHEHYEFVIFLKGDASFVVEGMEHQLAPYDVMISRPGEMHQIFHHSPAEYERIVITFSDSFFIHNDCIGYRDIFTEREIGRDNVIPAAGVQKASVSYILSRLESYIRDEDDNELVIRCALIELLYTLNRLKPKKAAGHVPNEAVLQVATYINQNLSGDLSLEYLSEKFFISKYYLCRTFKKYMGITVGQYITQKRILLAKSLHQDGYSLSEAATLCGFTDYSAFYKAFMKETGLSPREGLNRLNSVFDT